MGNPKIASFHLNAVCCFANKHEKTFAKPGHSSTIIHKMNEPSEAQEGRVTETHRPQDFGSEYELQINKTVIQQLCEHTCFAFSTLMLLVGRQEEHPTRPVKNWSDMVLVWLSVWSEVKMICLWPSPPIISCFIKSRMVYLLVAAYPRYPGKQAIKLESERTQCV